MFNNCMVKLKNVYMIYPNGVRALKNINLNIEKGEFIFIVGPTGCGKTTLLKLIYNEETPSRGDVFINGKNTLDLTPRQIPFFRRKIGIAFQDFKLLPHKTVSQNISFALEVTGASKFEINRKVPQVLNLVGLWDKKNALPDSLSAGEEQRVSIARAIVNEPSILIADEPTGNLDIDTSWDIIQLLLKIQMRGTTVIVATHDLSMVERADKRIITMSEEGRIISDSIAST